MYGDVKERAKKNQANTIRKIRKTKKDTQK